MVMPEVKTFMSRASRLSTDKTTVAEALFGSANVSVSPAAYPPPPDTQVKVGVPLLSTPTSNSAPDPPPDVEV